MMKMNKNYKNFKMNKIFNPILQFIYLPTPMNINMFWNIGSILGLFLMIQIISGFFLSIYYCPNINLAFFSVSHIMKDVNSGWMIRLIHMNGASFYFFMMYFHIARSLFYYSFKLKLVWMIGILIFLMSMMTAFMGYVLPWGQMSFWGAMVITNLLSAIPYLGQFLVEWIWGGFSINNATLNRFFSLHFILPLMILLLVLIHLIVLHWYGSSNPIGTNSDIYKIPFHPYFTIKDLLGFILILMIFMWFNFQFPFYFSDPDNFKMANSMMTPIHIKPEWYFLFAYSILRSIPNKLGGILGLLMSILILFFIPFFNNNMFKNLMFYPLNQFYYWYFIFNFFMLTWLGNQIIEFPYTLMNIFFTISYFFYFYLSFKLNKFWDYLIFNYN